MGVKNLWDILESCKKTLPLHHLQNKRVCVDLSYWLIQLQNVTKNPALKKDKIYLRNLFHRLRALIALNCSLIFVTDGSIPAIKLSTYRQRLGSSSEVSRVELNSQSTSSLPRNKGSEFSCMVKEAKILGLALGIPCLDGLEEAEAECALLNAESLCDGCFSADSDVFLFGAKTVYRDICLGESGYVICYEMEEIERKLGFGRNSLISLALLLGGDYSQGVHGIGPETACQIVKFVGDDNVLHRITYEGLAFAKKAKASMKQGQVVKCNAGKENGLDHKKNMSESKQNPVPDDHFMQVINAYLKPRCHLPESAAVQRVFIPHPFQRTKLQQICEQFFGWSPEITDEYILPKIAERDLRRFANLRYASSDLGVGILFHEIPVTCPVSAVLKRRKVHGRECFEVSWEKVDGLKTSTVPAELVERIVSVQLLANQENDQVFAKIRLEPIIAAPPVSVSLNDDSDSDARDANVVSFAKILTPSDANNGGGFSVPRFCADSIFPRLNFNANPPVQNISIRDVHGTKWEFRHIYRGTPRRHLLTTGWSKFVNQKKLCAGDSVLFIKHRSGELFVGIRRARSTAGGGVGRWKMEDDDLGRRSCNFEEGVFRNAKGKIPAESAVEAAQLASAGKPFEIIYYPNAGSPDFVVRAEAVEDALKVYWTVGFRVKMAMETEDSTRATWFQGTVSSLVASEVGIWRNSLWRSLQVTWDEPEVLQNVKRVNPWEVELVSATPQMQTPFTSCKKMRLSQDPDLLTDGEGPMFFPMMGPYSVIGNMDPSFFNYNNFPAGMQGARHNNISVPSFPNFGDHQLLYSDKLSGHRAPELLPISTDLSIGNNTSQSDNSSSSVQGSTNSFGKQPFGSLVCKPIKRTSSSFIQLFGQIIQTKQPIEGDVENGGCVGADSSKGCKETEGGALNYPSSYPYKQMGNQLDPQCQIV